MKTVKIKETKRGKYHEETEMNTGEYAVGTIFGMAALCLLIPAYFGFVKDIFKDN